MIRLFSWYRRPDPKIEALIKPTRKLFTGADESLPQQAAKRRAEADRKRQEAARIVSGQASEADGVHFQIGVW